MNFLRRMGWPLNPSSDEARLKWKTAMKFLIPMKFDVNRAISLYRSHEVNTENLLQIYILFLIIYLLMILAHQESRKSRSYLD